MARFLDLSEPNLQRNLLDQLGMDHDVFTLATTGFQKGACKRRHIEHMSRPTAEQLDKFAAEWDIQTSVIARDWEALRRFLLKSVAGVLSWYEDPMAWLRSPASNWKQALRRPGNWMGSVQSPDRPRARPGSGLRQYQSLQHCGDMVAWHERNVLRRKYDFVVMSRLDFRWVLPLPPLPLLQHLEPNAVWMPVTQSELIGNDRFAVVPRKHVAAVFDLRRLFEEGVGEKIVTSQVPGCGIPVYFGEEVSTEMFLRARLQHFGVAVRWLPSLFYVTCIMSDNPEDLRTLGWASCLPFTRILGGELPGEELEALQGAKYANEFMDASWVDNFLNRADESAGPPVSRLFGEQAQPPWTEDSYLTAAFYNFQMEIDRAGQGDCLRPARLQYRLKSCRFVLKEAFEAAIYEGALAESSVDLARARVLAAPWHLESWLWLLSVLLHPWAEDRAAASAVLERTVATLNSTHPALLRARHFLKEELPPSDEDFQRALGGPNATWQLDIAMRRNRILRQRRRMHQTFVRAACAAPQQRGGDDQDETSRLRCQEAWLSFGRLFVKEGWTEAAVATLAVLRRLVKETEAGLRRLALFEEEVRKVAEDADRWGTRVVAIEDYLIAGPSENELLSQSWLSAQEALTGAGGLDTAAPAIRNLLFGYNSLSGAKLIPTLDFTL